MSYRLFFFQESRVPAAGALLEQFESKQEHGTCGTYSIVDAAWQACSTCAGTLLYASANPEIWKSSFLKQFLKCIPLL